MYLYKDEILKSLNELKINYVSELDEKYDFLFPLLENDDWTMVIKSHVLIEKIVTNLIIAQTEQVKLKSFFERLPLSDEEIGKLAILKEYGLLSTRQRGFIKKFSTLRNNLIHDYEKSNFNLKDYLESMDKNQKKAWHNIITWFVKEKSSENSWVQFSRASPKHALWLSVWFFISKVLTKELSLKGFTEIEKQALKTTQDLI